MSKMTVWTREKKARAKDKITTETISPLSMMIVRMPVAIKTGLVVGGGYDTHGSDDDGGPP